MAKKSDPPQIPSLQPAPAAPAGASPAPAEKPENACPLCWGARQGTGVAYSTQRTRRYYKCKVCGHSWTAVISPARVEKVHSRPAPDLETRGGG